MEKTPTVAILTLALLTAPALAGEVTDRSAEEHRSASVPGEVGTWHQSGRLTSLAPHASTSGSQTDYGAEVAIDGDTAVVGAPYEDIAYVYESEEGVWRESDVLTGPAGFGEMVSVSGGVLAVGAPDVSSVVLFERVAEEWSRVASLDVPGTACLGSALALQEDMLVASDPCEAGAAYVFQPGSEGWSLTAEFTRDNDPSFSRTLALDGQTLLVGGLSLWAYDQVAGGWSGPTQVNPVSGAAVGLSGDTAVTGSAGQVLVFERFRPGGTWNQVAALEPADASPFTSVSERFAWTLDLTDGVLVAGAWNDDLTPGGLGVEETGGRPCASLILTSACLLPQPGSIYVFEFNAETGSWGQSAKLSGVAPSGEHLGISVAADSTGKTILAGAPGHPQEAGGFVDVQDSVHVFTRTRLVGEAGTRQVVAS